jgi:hypothetical protein
MDKVQKPINSECYMQLSEPFGVYNIVCTIGMIRVKPYFSGKSRAQCKFTS